MIVIAIGLVIGAILFWPNPGNGKANIRKPDVSLPDDQSVDFEKLLKDTCPATSDQYLVVGAGFLGSKLIHALLLRGEKRVRAFDIDPNALAPELRDHPHLEFIQGDVTKLADIQAACQDVDTVYCTFAIIRYFERLPAYAELSERINVGGTDRVLEACVAQGVKRLVHTSTSNVCAAPTLVNMAMSEESPYVTRDTSPNHYGWTKALAEQRVLEANGKDGMVTGSIRPCSGIFGRRDKMNLERLFKDRQAMMVKPRAYMDYVFVDNVAWGHLLLERAMQDGNQSVAGQAFCVGNEEPMSSEDFYFTAKAFIPNLKVNYMPFVFVRLLAHGVETMQRFIPFKLTPDKVGDLAICSPAMLDTCMTYVFKSTKAKDVLGYQPIYTVDQGIQKSLREYEAGRILPPIHSS